MISEIKLKAKAEVTKHDVSLEFGSTQADMWFSGYGKIQKTLKIKDDDRVEIIIRKM